MKWLLRILEQTRRHFKDGGKLRPLKPVFEATENFFFSSDARTPGPAHIRDPLDLKRFMSAVILALTPCVLTAVYFFGLRVLVMIAVSYVAGGVVETIFAIIRKEPIQEGFLVTGLIFPLILPPALPLWMVAVGVAFGVAVGKELFGGTGRNLFNPAIMGRCFLAIGYPAAMAGNWIKPGTEWPGRLLSYVDASTVDAMTSATPLIEAKQGVLASVSSLFLGNVSGSVSETSALAILVGGAFLLFTRVANWRTTVSLLGSFALLAFLMHQADPQKFPPVLWQLFAGGLLFGAFFMATDPVTSPITHGAKWACGVFIGVITLLIRDLTGYVEGVMFAILLGNIIAPMLDEVVIRYRLRGYRRE